MSQEQTVFINSNNKASAFMVQQIIQKTVPNKPTRPIMVKKKNKITLDGEASNQLLKKLGPMYKDSIIFESKPGGYIGNSPVKVSIVNRMDMLRKITKTVITYYDKLNGKKMSVKTSDRIARFIGQSNYETVLNALCSIKEEEIKVNALMALLTNEVVKDVSSQTDNEESDFEPKCKEIKVEKSVEEKCCQTDENCMDLIFKLREKRRVKRSVLTPYVVKDPPVKIIKKCVINIKTENACKPQDSSTLFQTVQVSEQADVKTESTRIPELIMIPEFNDNESVSNVTLSESLCGDEFLETEPFFKNIDLHTGSKEGTMLTVQNSQKHYIHIPNDKQIVVSVKPEFPFHMATQDILKTLSNEDKVKLINYQAFLDFKWCLHRDPDGYLPIHNAVMNNDVDLLRRQCVVLRYRQESVDIPAHNNLTALQISIYQDTPQCTAMLIQHDADPLLTDEEHRTPLHLACESSLDNLNAVIRSCESKAREILQDHDELWKYEYESKSNEELAPILLRHICEKHDSDGYTPLMISAKSGNYSAVRALLEASPGSVNQQVPNSGCTALFLAIEGACHDATNRSNKSKVADNFYQTISILLQNGADTNVTNHSGTSIWDILTDNGNTELVTLLSNKTNANMTKKFDSYMLLKDKNGDITFEELKKEVIWDKKMLPNNVKDDAKVTIAIDDKIKKEKPIILENIPIAHSPSKVFIDPINSAPNIKIGPKDKLITNKNKTHFNKKVIIPKEYRYMFQEETRGAKLKTTDVKILVKPTTPALKEFQDKAMRLAIIKKQQEAMKRKSMSESGPSEKKTKVDKTT